MLVYSSVHPASNSTKVNCWRNLWAVIYTTNREHWWCSAQCTAQESRLEIRKLGAMIFNLQQFSVLQVSSVLCAKLFTTWSVQLHPPTSCSQKYAQLVSPSGGAFAVIWVLPVVFHKRHRHPCPVAKSFLRIDWKPWPSRSSVDIQTLNASELNMNYYESYLASVFNSNYYINLAAHPSCC